ncbi:hypothetical protein PGTUg99_031834 [Puccinia graminis f. sp. tritici]|uniref:Uncharacterized protein n=1 Tax=Puccinia graminis f. sp. tritici TaxID=56615 RepID=A0A5B0SHE1_PUCGR|nr:hypothetical protein PGTUg99_031834 [Puccinia graminis f. sp. tritici]
MNVIQTQHLCPNRLVSSTLELKKPKRPAAHRVLDIVPATMGSSRMDPDIHWTSEFDRLFPGRLFMGRRDPSVLRTMKVPTILVGYNVNKWRLSDDCYTTDGETLTFPCGPSGCWDAGFLPEFWERRGISRSLLWCTPLTIY